jgi:hypothetical protein
MIAAASAAIPLFIFLIVLFSFQFCAGAACGVMQNTSAFPAEDACLRCVLVFDVRLSPPTLYRFGALLRKNGVIGEKFFWFFLRSGISSLILQIPKKEKYYSS